MAIVFVSLLGSGSASASGGTREVRYGDYAIRVPASWPVYDLATHPSRCVRFDRHAVYLGAPGADQRCPAHVVGRTEAIVLQPLNGSAAAAGQPGIVRAPRGRVAPARFPGGASGELRVEVPSAGVLVTATWLRHRDVVRRILTHAQRVAGARPPAPTTAKARPHEAQAPTQLKRGSGGATLGFDACAAPSQSAMSAWRSSPYEVAGVYVGGTNRGCSQPNLTAAWVRHEIAAGWGLLPIYVGPQAPGTSCGSCATIARSHAKAQGRAAARDAIRDMRALGLGSGTPVYFDMEYYARSSSNSATALRFMSGWTKRLHRGGYVSGVYSSGAAGIVDLVSRYHSHYREPDHIWIANWNGQKTTHDPYVPDSYWSDHQRVRQYRGGHNESYKGVSINIDNDYVDGAVAGAGSEDTFPTYVSGGLTRYLDSVHGDANRGDHFVTTGGVDPAYHFQGGLGFLYQVNLPGTIALYSCSTHHDQFVSRDSACGGDKVLGTLGYAYDTQPDGIPTRPIYRCRRPNAADELTVSYDPTCRNPDNVNEGLLGYTISVAPLGRYLDSVHGDANRGDHFVTTGGVDPAYHFQGGLGFLYQVNLPGTIALYSCSTHHDQFVSRDSACGGDKVLGTLGYAYDTQPDGIPTRPIYRCRRHNGEHFVWPKRRCKRASNVNEGRLGYALISPLVR